MTGFPLRRSVDMRPQMRRPGRGAADVRPQSSVPYPLHNLTQLAAIRLNHEVDRQAVRGPRLSRSDDGHQRSSGPDHACRPLPDIAADDVEHQVDARADSRMSFSRSTNSCTPKSSAF